MTVTAPQPEAWVRRRGVQVFASIAAAHLLVDCYGAVFPMFKYLVGLDRAWAGMISTFSFLIGAAMQPVFGIWADHGRQRRFVILGAVLVTAAVLLEPVGRHIDMLGNPLTYAILFGLLLTVRIGQAIFHPAAASLVGNAAGRRRTTMLSIFIAIGMVGFAAGQPLFYLVHHRLNEHTEWLLLPAALIVCGAAWWCRPSAATEVRRIELGAIVKSLHAVRGRLFMLFVIQATTSGIGMGVFFLMPEFLESRGQPALLINGGGAFLWVFGAALFMMPIGYLADRLGRRRVLTITVALAAAAYYTLIGLPSMSALLCGLGLLVGGGLLGSVNPVSVSLGQQLAPQHVSVVSGVLMGLAWSVGATAQWFVGWLSKSPTFEIGGALAVLGVAFVPALILSALQLINQSGRR